MWRSLGTELGAYRQACTKAGGDSVTKLTALHEKRCDGRVPGQCCGDGARPESADIVVRHRQLLERCVLCQSVCECYRTCMNSTVRVA